MARREHETGCKNVQGLRVTLKSGHLWCFLLFVFIITEWLLKQRWQALGTRNARPCKR